MNTYIDKETVSRVMDDSYQVCPGVPISHLSRRSWTYDITLNSSASPSNSFGNTINEKVCKLLQVSFCMKEKFNDARKQENDDILIWQFNFRMNTTNA